MEKRNLILIAACLQFVFALPAALSAAPTVPVSTSPAVITSRDEAAVADLQAKCQKGEFNFLDFAAKADAYPAALRPNLPLEMKDIAQYFTCLASLPDPQKNCESMRGFPDQENAIKDCRRHAQFYTMIRKAFQSGDAASDCQKLVSVRDLVSEKDVPLFCATLLPTLKAGGAADFCAKLQAAGVVFKPGRSCAAPMQFLSGPAACDSAPANDRRRCSDDAAFLKGLRSGDPRVCAASPMCNAVVNKNPRACEAYLAQANKGTCDRVSRLAKFAEGAAATRREALANEAAAAARLRAIQKEEDARKATLNKEAEVKALKAKAAQEVDAAKAAALKKSDAETTKFKMIAEIRKQRREAERKKSEAPPQMRKNAPLQQVPPDVQKRIDEAQKRGAQ